MNIKKRIKLLNVIGYTLVAIQVLSFIGSLGREEEPITEMPVLIGSYIGSNLFFIIALVLFLRTRSLRKKLNNSNQIDLINSIGKTENN